MEVVVLKYGTPPEVPIIKPVPPEVTTTGIVRPTVPVVVIGFGVRVMPVSAEMEVTVPIGFVLQVGSTIADAQTKA
jgi:hypothetical protein